MAEDSERAENEKKEKQRERFECEICKKTFGSKEGLEQHKAAKHTHVEEKVVEKKRKSIKGYVIALVVIFAIIALFWFIARLPKTPAEGSHWHAQYEISICGETLPDYPASPDLGIHTHGDGLIHIHPHTQEAARENANLARFFTSLGGVLTNSSIKLSDGREFKNGDLCNNTPGRVRVVVNSRERAEAEKYVPKDGDVIQIMFSD